MKSRFSAGITLAVGILIGAACTHAVQEAAAPEAVAETTAPPAPAYMLVSGKVYDRAAFGAGYAAKLPPLYEKFGGSYVGIGRDITVLEGEAGYESFVLARWPSKEAALAFWNSPEYDELRRARIEGGWGEFDVVLLGGLPEPATVAPMVSEGE